MKNLTSALLDKSKENPLLAPFENLFKQTTCRAIDITASSQPIVTGCSKFGGVPDLPSGTSWPHHPQAYYRFITQINFAEIDVTGTELPKDGLLSLFYAEDEGEGTVFWGDVGYIHSTYTPAQTEVYPHEPADKACLFPSSRRIQFRPCIDIPYDEYQTSLWPEQKNNEYDFYDQKDAYHQFRDSLHTQHYLLGYPSHYSLAYNPIPGDEYISFISLDSDNDLQWEWHDANKLMIFIKKADLTAGNFSALLADAG